MNPSSLNEQPHHILFDSDNLSEIVPQWFNCGYWQDRAEVKAVSAGRGRAWFIDSDKQSMVLRHYQRGGWIANLLGDKYLWSGLNKTRAWREWHLLCSLWQQGLPVPQPLAAHVEQKGLFYCADLLTCTIPQSQPLSGWLNEQTLSSSLWQSIGALICRFHNANIYHADLNAHNILITEQHAFYLIDFDRGRSMPASSNQAPWKKSNLKRLRRSLMKLRNQNQKFNFNEDNWLQLIKGYSTKK